MLKKKVLAVLATTILMVPQLEARSLEKIFTECGIGGMIFKTVPAGAAISNIIWDLGTTATSSDISSPESCKGSNAQVAMLIGNSYDKLEVEIAQGSGKYLDTLSTLSGKSVSEIRTKFSTSLVSEKHTKMQKAEKLFNIVSL